MRKRSIACACSFDFLFLVPFIQEPVMSKTWKDVLQGQISEDWAREIDNFEAQMTLRKANKIEEKIFAETLPLRRTLIDGLLGR